jgi:glycosyltransferase involved in cell wall biosynthesis
MTQERIKKVTKIFVKSKYQRELYPHLPDDKFVIVPNGIDASLFSMNSCPVCHKHYSLRFGGCEHEIKRDDKLVICTSAPNRGLSAFIDMAKEIKAKVPDAKFQWAYGWKTWDVPNQGIDKQQEWKALQKKKMVEYGVDELGRISHEEIAKLYLKANVFFYPSFFAEIDCISLSKAMAAGAVPVTTDFAALGEKQGHGGFFYHAPSGEPDDLADFSVTDPEIRKQMVAKVVQLLDKPPVVRYEMRRWATETFDWLKVAEKWNDILTQ